MRWPRDAIAEFCHPGRSAFADITPATERPGVAQLDCYYSLSSPWAYLGGPRLQDIVRRHQAKLTLKPYDFQAIVPKTGSTAQ